MNYTAHYEALITRARVRTLTAYSERHHVIPKCLGGSNEASNIVRLTPEEHYVAHQLLVKMYPGHHGLVWAAVAMTNGTTRRPRRNKLYGWLRRQLATRLSERFTGGTHTEVSRAQMRASHLGKKRPPHTADTKAKMSAASKGREKSHQHCQALSAAKKLAWRDPMYRTFMTQRQRERRLSEMAGG
jgi:hypothetical protein